MNYSLAALLLAILLSVAACPAWSADDPSANVPASVVSQVKQARELRLHNQPAQARDVLEPIVKQYPNYYLARYNLGLTYQALNQNDAAIAQLDAAKKLNVEQNIGEPTIYNSLGWAKMQSGDYQSALSEFKTAQSPEIFSKLTPESQRKVLNNTGLTYAYLGQTDEAAKLYKQAEAVNAPASTAAR